MPRWLSSGPLRGPPTTGTEPWRGRRRRVRPGDGPARSRSRSTPDAANATVAGQLLSDNSISPSTTTTPPHCPRLLRGPVSDGPAISGSSRRATGQRRASEEADGGNDQARRDWPGRHEGGYGPKDSAQVRGRRQAAVGDADAARVADAA